MGKVNKKCVFVLTLANKSVDLLTNIPKQKYEVFNIPWAKVTVKCSPCNQAPWGKYKDAFLADTHPNSDLTHMRCDSGRKRQKEGRD